jgi:hypothetical protein
VEARKLSMQNPQVIYLRAIIEAEQKKFKAVNPDIALLVNKYY